MQAVFLALAYRAPFAPPILAPLMFAGTGVPEAHHGNCLLRRDPAIQPSTDSGPDPMSTSAARHAR